MVNRDLIILRMSAAIGLLSFVILGFLLITERHFAEQYVAVLWHFGMLLVVAVVAAPSWAKAMGFAWIAIEFILSGAVIQGLSNEMAQQFRFGGAHICTAFWVAGAISGKGRALQLIGIHLALVFLITALIPSSLLPRQIMGAMFVLMLSWVGGLAIAGERVLGSRETTG